MKKKNPEILLTTAEEVGVTVKKKLLNLNIEIDSYLKKKRE